MHRPGIDKLALSELYNTAELRRTGVLNHFIGLEFIMARVPKPG